MRDWRGRGASTNSSLDGTRSIVPSLFERLVATSPLAFMKDRPANLSTSTRRIALMLSGHKNSSSLTAQCLLMWSALGAVDEEWH